MMEEKFEFYSHIIYLLHLFEEPNTTSLDCRLKKEMTNFLQFALPFLSYSSGLLVDDMRNVFLYRFMKDDVLKNRFFDLCKQNSINVDDLFHSICM